ncbi:IS3 family transposase [Enterococcus thailandicus]|uniref:IS3 family transposase n=1 Tax=Enterococcus TaxID=1350 RepID=UPI0035D575E1
MLLLLPLSYNKFIFYYLLVVVIGQYIEYYNIKRMKKKLNWLNSVEFRKVALSAV